MQLQKIIHLLNIRCNVAFDIPIIYLITLWQFLITYIFSVFQEFGACLELYEYGGRDGAIRE